MEFAFLTNGAVGLQALEGFIASGHRPLLTILNKANKQRDGDAIRDLCQSENIPSLTWGQRACLHIQTLAEQTDGDLWLLSAYFGHIVPDFVLAAVKGRAVNLHPSLLPWGRGANTNVWPIITSEPAGVTLHAMVPSVDAGPILIQEEVPVYLHDTAASLFQRLEHASVELLNRCWPDEVVARWPGSEQQEGGTFRTSRAFESLSEVSLDGKPNAIELFNLLRAKTFDPFPGLIVQMGEERVRATIKLRPINNE